MSPTVSQSFELQPFYLNKKYWWYSEIVQFHLLV